MISFSAPIDMKKDEILALEEAYAKLECPVVSNNSANRGTPDVPMVVPELNADHIEIIKAQRKRLGTKKDLWPLSPTALFSPMFPPFSLLRNLSPKKVLVCTYQAISGAGKTFERWPEMIDNVIPYIGGEEEKSEQELLRFGVTLRAIRSSMQPVPLLRLSAYACPLPTVTLPPFLSPSKRNPPSRKLKRRGRNMPARHSVLSFPSAPKQFLNYFEEPDRPQIHSKESLSTEWPFPWADFAKIRSMTINLFAFPQHSSRRCRVVLRFLPSFLRQRAIWTECPLSKYLTIFNSASRE